MEALTATVRATHNVALACARTATRRLVYLSTEHVYGARIAPGVTLSEEMRAEPRSAYAISRLASEHLAAGVLGEDSQLLVLRLTNSVGAPADARVDRWSLVANDLCRQGSVDGRLQLRSSGVRWRDFVALADVCSAIVIASRAHDPAVAAGTYNFGSGRPRTVRALAEVVQDAFGRETGTRPELRAPDPEPDPPGGILRLGRASATARPQRTGTARGRGRGRRALLPESQGETSVSDIHDLRVTPLRRIPDDRGAVQELHVGELNYSLVPIPPLVCHRFKGEGASPALVANCATHPHDPEEIERMDPFDARVPFDWSLRHG
jgi:hypothetical protein